MIGEDHEPALPPVGATRADGFAGWLREGWRSALGCRVQWVNLRAGPAFVLALIAGGVLLDVALQRLLIEGPASFWWYGLGNGWWVSLALLWLCWVAAASPPGAATVFALLQMQWLVIGLATGVVSVMATRSQALAGGPVQAWILWAVWWATLIWWIGAALLVLWRAAEARAPARRVAVVALFAIAAAQLYAPAARYWYPDRDDSAAEAPEAPRLTQEVLEAQPGLLDTQLRALAPQRAGVIDLYAITFAPYAGEDVFRRESELVSSVVRDRFDAAGRTLQLVNSERTMQSLAWATPLNLRRAIDGIAARMDRDEDVLLIHLTSHGARDGQLASGSWPPFVRGAVTPADLRALARRRRHPLARGVAVGLLFGQLDRPADRCRNAGDDRVRRRAHVLRLRPPLGPDVFRPGDV